jgi:TonB-linked SusC/RagA family outer membrane protein
MREVKFICSLFSKRLLTAVLLLIGTSAAYSSPESNPESETVKVVFAEQQQKTIKGVITDASSGESIIGASIIEKGATNGTVSDINGNFQLIVPANAAIEISFIGYVTQTIQTSNRDFFTVQLREDMLSLSEVVVVGYGVQKKANLTGSVSSVNFEELALSRPVTNVSSALAGLSSGVQVMQTSGQPGDDGARIRIRGNGTLNDNNPLVIIDGMENVIDAVIPQDIESISVLKDAASSAIYGARAANGVILITTKKGTKGKVSVNYTGRFSQAKPTNLIELISDYADYMEWINEGFINTNQKANFNQSTIDLWREKSQNPNATNEIGVPNYVAFPNTDWQRELFNGSIINDHSISVNGGSENSHFLISMGYLDNPGLVENTGIKRYSLRTNLETNVNKWLTVGTNIYATQEDKDTGNFTNANNYLRQTTPGLYPRWQGKNGYPEAPEENAQANSLYTFLNTREGDIKKSRINTTMFSKIRFIEGLSWDFNLNYKRRWDEERIWTNAANAEKVKFSTGETMTSPTSPAEMTTSFSDYANHSYTLENLLRYSKTFLNVHDISALAGYQEYYYYTYTNSASKKGLIDASVTVPSAAVEMQSISGSSNDVATRSFFGRVNYGYKSRYLLEANIRRDATSRYHKDHRWGTYPSVSGAWRISEEAFMTNTRNVLDNLKLRLSWGQVGNTGGDDVGNYEYQSVYSAKNYIINNTLAPGLAVSAIANSLLSWESTTQTNIGLDATLFHNHLNVELDLYNKLTKDILYRPGINPVAGTVTAPRMNIAEMRNRGIETTVSWNNKINDFFYSISANFAYNNNKVIKYKGEYKAGWETGADGEKVYATNLGDVSTGGTERVVEGKKMNEFYLRAPYKGDGTYFNSDGTVNKDGGPKDGMIRTEQDMEWLKAMIANGSEFQPNKTVSKTKIWYGDYIYADTNGDNIYGSSYDENFQGVSSQPKYNFGMQLSAAWKGFDASMNWAGSAGFNLYWAPTTGYNSTGLRVGLAIPKEIAYNHYFYDPENPSDPRTNLNAKYSRLTNGESGYQIHTSSTLHLYKGDYLKLKNLTIGYSVPKNIAHSLFTENLRVYVTGENLLSITSFPGQDPEMGATPTYTSLKQYAFGINITF